MNQYGALIGDSKTTFNTSFNIIDTLPEDLSIFLNLKIQTCLDQYVNLFGVADCILENTWASFQYPHSKLQKHTHPGSEVSGVLYLKADEKSSPIYFYNPNPFISFTTVNPNDTKEFLIGSTRFKPKTGSILIFPSWLQHGSGDDENMSEERIILSFNTKSYKESV